MTCPSCHCQEFILNIKFGDDVKCACCRKFFKKREIYDYDKIYKEKIAKKEIYYL